MMQGPAAKAGAGGPRPSLAQRAFPRRVRALLEGVFDFVSDELDRGLVNTMNEFEQHLFKLAEQSRSNEVQKHNFEALREIKRGRADVTPRFLLGLESSLATLKDPPRAEPLMERPMGGHELSLVDELVMDEAGALNEIAVRAEVRNSLPLFLLGQRFGVIAGRPAFDSETLPIGPHALCHVLREAAGSLDLNLEYRQHLYRQFDRSVMQFIGPMYEAVNTYLIKHGVLPYLKYVPIRAKPTAQTTTSTPEATRPTAAEAGTTKGGQAEGTARSESPSQRAAGSYSAPGSQGAPGSHGSPGSYGAPGSSGSGAQGSPGSYGAPGLHGSAGSHGAPGSHGPAGSYGAPGSLGSPGAQGAPGSQGSPASYGVPGAHPLPGSPASQGLPRSDQAFSDDPHHPPAPAGPHPHTAWPGTAPAAPETKQDAEMFDVLRQLLAGRRSLLGKLGSAKPAQGSAPSWVASGSDVQSVLGRIQLKPPTPVVVDGKSQPRSVTQVKQDLLAQLRQVAPGGHAPALAEEHGDTIDLVGMLFDHIMKDVRPNSAAASLLTKLQVPLLRVALDDKGFFTRKQHPARQMLNTIAESGEYWSSEDAADRVVVDKMQMLVDKVTKDFTGDLTLFDALLGDLNSHMQTQARKAEVAERRHVEAARGKEKLELARLNAAEAIDAKLSAKPVPKFLHTLLAQAWSDVLALSLLRGGEDSDGFKHQLHIAERLIDSAVERRNTGKPLIGPVEAQGLKHEIEDALAQVGYHGNDAQQISTRLLAASGEEEDDDPASRTELAMKLRSRTRLGQNVDQGGPSGEKLAPLQPAEQACYDRLRHLPFGTWFEFTTNQQGEKVRRRMSWYSTVTGHCLFVNHRGQRVGEYSLNWLARELHRGNLRIVEAEQDSIIDRAWGAIMGALRSFAGRPAPAAT